MAKKMLLSVLGCFLFAGVMEAAIAKVIVLSDKPASPEAIVLSTGKIVKTAKSKKSMKDIVALSEKAKSPIVYFDSGNGGLLGFIGSTGLGFIDKAFCASLRGKTGSQVVTQMSKTPLMEKEAFIKAYSKKPKPAWPRVPVQISDDIQAVFLKTRPSKYIGVGSRQRMYIVEVVSASSNSKSVRIRIHTQDSFVSLQGMHSVNHPGYPGAFIVYGGEEFHRKYNDGDGGSLKLPELLSIKKSNKSPVIYWDTNHGGKLGFVGVTNAMFITERSFQSLRRPQPRQRAGVKKKDRYAPIFAKGSIMSEEEYSEKYGSAPKAPYPKMPVQMTEESMVIFLKKRLSDYVLFRTEDERTFVFKIHHVNIGMKIDVQTEGFGFRLYEME